MREEGVFRDFRGRLTYDSNHPDNSHIHITVQAVSVDTGNATRDAVLRSDDFFDATAFPTLRFISERVTSRSKSDLEVSGRLTIHGVTKQITVPAHINGIQAVSGVGTLAGFETTFTIDRALYGVNGFRWSAGTLVISKTVTIHSALGCVRI